MPQVVVVCIPLITYMTVRAKNYVLVQRSSQAFRDIRFGQPSFPTACHVQVVLSVGSYYNLSLVIRYAPAFRIGPPFAGRTFEMTVAFLGFFKKCLVTFHNAGKRTAFVLLERTQYLMTPVKGRFLIYIKCCRNLIQRLLVGHQFQIKSYKCFLVKPLLPRTCIFGEGTAAILAFEALGTLVLAETVIVLTSTMRAAALLIQKLRQTGRAGKGNALGRQCGYQ